MTEQDRGQDVENTDRAESTERRGCRVTGVADSCRIGFSRRREAARPPRPQGDADGVRSVLDAAIERQERGQPRDARPSGSRSTDTRRDRLEMARITDVWAGHPAQARTSRRTGAPRWPRSWSSWRATPAQRGYGVGGGGKAGVHMIDTVLRESSSGRTRAMSRRSGSAMYKRHPPFRAQGSGDHGALGRRPGDLGSAR